MEVRGGVENGGITAITGDYGYEPNGVIHDMTNFPEDTLCWRGTDSNFRFPERSVKRKGRAGGRSRILCSSFVSLPYGYPATSCVGINPKNLNRPPKR